MLRESKSSSAVGDWAPLGCAIFSGDVTNWEVEELKDGSRNGFLEVGRGGGSSKGERGSGEARLLGDAARLRKGLLDERLSDRPADGPVVVRWLDGWPRPSRSPSIADIVAKTCFDVSDLVFSHSQVATLLFPMSQSARLSVGCQEECLADEQRVGSDSVLVWASGQWLLCRAI